MTEAGVSRATWAARLAAVVLVVPLLAGCGGKDYCQTVSARQTRLGSITNADSPTGALEALPILQELEGKAPADVQQDYQLVVTRIEALRNALQAAHVTPSQWDPQHPPAGVDAGQRRAIRTAAAGLAAADTAQALASIQQEVLDVCHTPLEL